MNYKEFYDLLHTNKFITPIWQDVAKLLELEIKDTPNFDEALKIFLIYFSLIEDGNICMSLDEDVLSIKWDKKLSSMKTLLEEDPLFDSSCYSVLEKVSKDVIKEYLSIIKSDNLSNLIGNNRLFNIDNNYLYANKYYIARKGIIESISRLFLENKERYVEIPDYNAWIKDEIVLSNGQTRALENGLRKNLIITGGPGTGKTTSILFLLLVLLKEDTNYNVYLTAPSGKASSRMKESILKGLVMLKVDFLNENKNIIDIIKNLEESTIHRLLSYDFETNDFDYNSNHKFPKNSIFIIDEASMIDVCIFNSLLNAIPDNAKVYIMGDKNQLPSVDCGAVLGDLIKNEKLKNNLVELDESKRFSEDTKIFALAKSVNNGTDLPVNDADWQDYKNFKIEKIDDSKPIFYYNDTSKDAKEVEIIEHIVNVWANEFFKNLQNMCSNLDVDYEKFKSLFAYMEKSKILCAENDSVRGVNRINKYIKNNFIDKNLQTSIVGSFTGEVMMINKNNKSLDLYNGDTGITVTFNGDDTLYLMVNKSSVLVTEDGKKTNKIFKIKDFVFYPLRLIAKSEINLAYAISIHKSQGSDYPNILVILPKKKGHPLLNRQIVYTAITRTKGNTYIVSNIMRLNEGKDTQIIRDTNIVV